MEQERRENTEVRQTGRKGGAASMAASGMPAAAQRTAVAYWSPDTIRWGPVWSGVLVALAVDLVLMAIGIASAFASFDPASASSANDMARFMAIWSAASLIAATFIGGWIAGRNGAFLGMRAGWFQGTVVWALVLLASLLLSSLIATGMIGSASNLVPAAMRSVSVSAAGADMNQAQLASAARDAARAISYAAWLFLIGAVVAWGAGALGGWWGASGNVVDEADVES